MSVLMRGLLHGKGEKRGFGITYQVNHIQMGLNSRVTSLRIKLLMCTISGRFGETSRRPAGPDNIVLNFTDKSYRVSDTLSHLMRTMADFLYVNN